MKIEQLSENQILLNQGTIYALLVRLQRRGWISAEWGVSDNNRKANFYAITRSGETANETGQDLLGASVKRCHTSAHDRW
jgi:DNA-binding PadR family transcriptional regulator